MRIAVDFDSTIHDPFNRNKGYKMGLPIPGAIDALAKLRKEGHEIIIFPTWAVSEVKRRAIVDWLNYFGAEFDDITSVKPTCEAYIDNNAIRFITWEQTLRDLKKYDAQV